MKNIKPLLLLSFLFLVSATQCSEDDFTEISCQERIEDLDQQRLVIENLINSSICSDDFECRAIAFGSKACGGPHEYLIYTTSIDTLQLQSLVEDYNVSENNYNLNCDVVSDCLFVSGPIGFECVDEACIAQY